MKSLKIALAGITVAAMMWMGWVFASYVDIVSHNNEPNPQYQEWNFFTKAFPNEDKQEQVEAKCGDFSESNFQIRYAEIYSISQNEIVFVTDDGNLWAVAPASIDDYDANGFYCLFFDDEEIVKIFREVY